MAGVDDNHIALILSKFDENSRQMSSVKDELTRQMADDRRESGESRRRVHEKIDIVSREVLDLTMKVKNANDAIEGMSPTVAEFVMMKTQAQGAGKLGSALWTAGRILLATASAAAGYWAAVSGWFRWPSN